MERSFLLECHCPDPDSVDVRRIDSDFPSVDRPRVTRRSPRGVHQSIDVRRREARGTGTRDASEPRWANSASVVRYRSSIACGSSQQRRRGEQEIVGQRDDGADRAGVGRVLVGIVIGRLLLRGFAGRIERGVRDGEIGRSGRIAGAACAAAPWKCPNDSANWIASANSASREPCLRCFRNQFTTSCAFPERPRQPRPSQCYIITSERVNGGECQPQRA